MTRRDLLRSPFHASEETTTCFLRHLRALRLHAFVAAVMNRCGEDNKTRRRVGDRGGTYTDLDSEGMMEGEVSQWQERRYTLRKVIDGSRDEETPPAGASNRACRMT